MQLSAPSAVVVACFTVLTTAALAQAQVPPDVVRLRGGGLVRGTIIEHLPGGPVHIQLVTGEERRIEADQVEWAGPATEMPSSATDAEAGEARAPEFVGPTPPSLRSAGDSPSQAAPEAPPSYANPSTPPTYASPVTVGDPMTPRTPGSPAAALPGTPVATGVVPIQFESDREGVRIDAQVGTNSFVRYGSNGLGYTTVPTYNIGMPRVVTRPVWRQLCVAPCTQEFAAGRVHIGVALEDGGRTYRINQAIMATQPSIVRIHWGDRYAMRVGGSIAWALGGAGGTAMLIPGAVGLSGYGGGESLALLVAGASTVAISTIVGLIFALMKDELSIEQTPL